MRGLLTLVLLSVLCGACAKDTPPTATTQASPPAGDTTANQATAPTPAPATAANVVKPHMDACGLITAAEIQSIQGEAPRESKLSGQNSGGLKMSQCFFTLPTFSNSVSLTVAHKADGSDAREPKDFWQNTFGAEAQRKERPKRKAEKTDPPKPVPGVGDEAFWAGNKFAGALYVLKGNAYVRVSVGGSSDKLRQSNAKALAQKAVARLQ